MAECICDVKGEGFDVWKWNVFLGVLLWWGGEGEIDHEACGDEWSVEVALAASEGVLVFFEELCQELRVLDVLDAPLVSVLAILFGQGVNTIFISWGIITMNPLSPITDTFTVLSMMRVHTYV